MKSRSLSFNGINGRTGRYLPSPQTVQQLARFARGEHWSDEHLQVLHDLHWRLSQGEVFAPTDRVDAKDLASTGWGAIFARDCDPAVYEALTPLLKWREQAAQRRYREFYDKDAYVPGQTASAFLRKWGANATGPVNTDKMPYYLLLVGTPGQISYRFQYELDIEYAVGRLSFQTPQEYANYAQSVLDAERRRRTIPPQAVFFGTQNPDDTPTRLSAQYLVEPLVQSMAKLYPDWHIHPPIVGETATKEQLGRLLGGAETPDFLFTASHGLWLPGEDDRKLKQQGAFICQDWPGPLAWEQALPEHFYFAADDIEDNAHLRGAIGFHFACYSAGTPETDDFAEYSGAAPRPIHQPFLAALPQRLLGHPRGGLRAFIGHIERTWGYSFYDDQNMVYELEVFEETLGRLLRGFPVGYAMEFFNHRYAQLAAGLNNDLDAINRGAAIDDDLLAQAWISNNDARNYIILGDPAVALKESR